MAQIRLPPRGCYMCRGDISRGPLGKSGTSECFTASPGERLGRSRPHRVRHEGTHCARKSPERRETQCRKDEDRVHEQRLWSAVEGYRALLTQTEVRLRRSHEILASTNAVLHQSRLVNTRIRMDEMNDRHSSGGEITDDDEPVEER